MLEVEQVFSSYGRVKVMSVIMKSEELNISEITRRAGISHSSVALHLDFLVRAGLLTEKRFNRIRIFRVNHSNPYAEALERFLADWRSLDPGAGEIAFN
ncbi:MAG: winged helix-turn-helix transcriptional regulator [Nitrososphaerota archaeon]|jgi:DNA-binding transcriptional ArsR family regulator|nr:winged helix-turn-helix transcriptional regulator [Nitrososphaerota archaeon]